MKTIIKNNLKILLIGLAAFIFTACHYSYISEDLIFKLINSPQTVIIDVRPRTEFVTGNIPHSINIPLESLSRSLKRLDPYTDIIFVCKTGARSTKAIKITKKITNKKFYNGGNWQRINTILKTSRQEKYILSTLG